MSQRRIKRVRLPPEPGPLRIRRTRTVTPPMPTLGDLSRYAVQQDDLFEQFKKAVASNDWDTIGRLQQEYQQNSVDAISYALTQVSESADTLVETLQRTVDDDTNDN